MALAMDKTLHTMQIDASEVTVSSAISRQQSLCLPCAGHSHSIVPGGLPVMS